MSPICAGREAELAALRKEFAAVAQGKPRVVWIDGEPGMGKTTLVRAFLAEGGHRAAWTSCDEEEADLRYGVVTTCRKAIAAAVGAQSFGQFEPPTYGDAFAAGAQLMVEMGASNDPLVVVIDDLQWADQQSASALRFVLRRLLGEPILVILITRPDPADTLGEHWARHLSDPELTSHLPLGGLTTDGVVDLLIATGKGGVERPLAERLRSHTNGNPLHTRALIDELGETGLRKRGVLPAPRSFAQLTVSRLSALGGDGARMVTAGAVLGSTFSVELAAEVAAVGEPDLAVDRAISVGLLERTANGDAHFPHPLLRAAVYNDIPPGQLRSLHHAAASVTHGARSLDHRVAATVGPDDALAAELDRRAVKEWVTGRGSEAYEHFMAASRLSSTPSSRDRRLLEAVEALFSAGDYSRAFAMREVVLGLSESAHRSYILGMIDMTPQAADHFSAAATAANDETDIFALRLRAIGGRAIVHMRQGRYESALADAEAASMPAIEGWASGLLRWVRLTCLAQLGRTAEARSVLANRQPELLPTVALDDLCGESLLAVVDDDLAGAVSVLKAVAARAQGGETCRLLEIALSLLATVHYLLGNWDESALNSEIAVALYGETGREQIAVTHCVAAFVHAGRGHFDLAEADVQAAEGAYQFTQTVTGAYYVAMTRAVLAQARGAMSELRAATAPLLDGRIQPSIEGLDPWSWRVLAIEGLLGTGELSDARRALADLSDLVNARGWHSPTTDMIRLNGELAEQSGDEDAALAIYRSALDDGGVRKPLPLPAARLSLSYGSLLRRTGARRLAIEQLRAAHTTLAALGAAPFLAICDAELAACGLQAPPAARTGRLALTAAEESVAHLIAQGLTNREAAAQLYVSPATVDYHLRHIYAKLGITSRRDLTTRLRPIEV